MSPSYTDNQCPMRGIMSVDYCGYIPAVGGPGYNVTIVPGVTACLLCNFLINQNKIDQYIFNEEGKGYRHWCATALEKLEAASYTVEKGIAINFAQDEANSAVTYGSQYHMPSIISQFYE